MNISYDIFDLVDFPIIITDKSFIITYKNKIAYEYFGKLRKRSKITKYITDSERDMNFSGINELEFETGTLIKRALSVALDENSFIFLFLSALQFEGYKKIAKHIRENFSGNFVDFYVAAHREYTALQSMTSFEKANVPERVYADLMELLRSLPSKPVFMQTEAYNLAEIIAQAANRASESLHALGLKISGAEFDEDARDFCWSNINLYEFLFVLFRLIYTAFKLSSDGALQIFLEYLPTDTADICVSARTSLEKDDVPNGDFASLVKLLPEFAFEFVLLTKYGAMNPALSFSIENSVLKIHFCVKCESAANLLVRSEPSWQREKRIARAISELLAKTKNLLSKNSL